MKAFTNLCPSVRTNHCNIAYEADTPHLITTRIIASDLTSCPERKIRNVVKRTELMAGQEKDDAEKHTLDQQLQALLHHVESEPTPDEMRKLALELQKTLKQRRGDEE